MLEHERRFALDGADACRQVARAMMSAEPVEQLGHLTFKGNLTLLVADA